MSSDPYRKQLSVNNWTAGKVVKNGVVFQVIYTVGEYGYISGRSKNSGYIWNYCEKVNFPRGFIKNLKCLMSTNLKCLQCFPCLSFTCLMEDITQMFLITSSSANISNFTRIFIPPFRSSFNIEKNCLYLFEKISKVDNYLHRKIL